MSPLLGLLGAFQQVAMKSTSAWTPWGVGGDESGGTARVIEDTHVGVRGGACRIRRQRDARERNRVVRKAKRHVAVRMEAREGEGVDRERPVAVEGEATREVLDDRRLEELAALSGVRGAVLAACECAAA